MTKRQSAINLKYRRKNDALIDAWSFVHLFTGATLVLFISPYFALVLMVLWEPLEILILSPFLAKRGILFGHETLTNSLSDIVFDVIGVSLGFFIFVS